MRSTAFKTGVLCISVDAMHLIDPEAGSRFEQVADLMYRFQVHCNWMLLDLNGIDQLPAGNEITVLLPGRVTRTELIQRIRRAAENGARRGEPMQTVALDHATARQHWDMLVKLGYRTARPRESTPTISNTEPKTMRGGLAWAPVSCAFVGGSRRTVQSQFARVRERLRRAADLRELFHLVIDVGMPRVSWDQEFEALTALLQSATMARNDHRLRSILLSELGSQMVGRNSIEQQASILRKAA